MNKEGIVIISIGKPVYGRLACVLAASIRCKSAIPIHLIHDKESIADLRPRQKALFSSFTQIDTNPALTDSENAFSLKCSLYRLSPYDKTLFLDADNIMLPGKSVNTWFTELDGVMFATQCMGAYEYKTGNNINKQAEQTYPYWGDPLKVKEHFKIMDDSYLTQINSSFVYFERCPQVEELFRVALTVYKDTTFKSHQYRHAKPDEFCFNVACALTKTFPHNMNYRPIYFHFTGENISEPFINDNYNALSVIADEKFDDRLLEMYNKYMDYYFQKMGFTDRYYFNTKSEKEQRRIVGFWHIAAMGNWKEVVTEQLAILLNDGLYQSSDVIVVSVGGGASGPLDNDVLMVRDLLSGYSKFQINSARLLGDYEFPALQLIKAAAAANKFYGYYFHTKGVSQPKSVQKAKWRDLLNHYVLRCWAKCYSKVSTTYDVAGVNWKDGNHDHPGHFSGNFYWFDSEYIKRLPEVYTLDRKNRYKAEMWISAANPKVFSVIFHKMEEDNGVPEWFPERKIGLFWTVGDDYASKIQLLRNSELFSESHHSVALTASPQSYDLGGFICAAPTGYHDLLKTYCILNPDAFIVFPTDPDAIVNWKLCYRMLLNGYDSVVNRRGEYLWVTAALLNLVDHELVPAGKQKKKKPAEIRSHRKFIL